MIKLSIGGHLVFLSMKCLQGKFINVLNVKIINQLIIKKKKKSYPPFFDDNTFGVYEKILLGKIHFPTHIESPAKDIIRKLLTVDRNRRLGNSKRGAEDVKEHKWFKGIDWERLYKRKLQPPFVPNVAHPGDTRWFEKYDDESMDINMSSQNDDSGDERYGDLFSDFAQQQPVTQIEDKSRLANFQSFSTPVLTIHSITTQLQSTDQDTLQSSTHNPDNTQQPLQSEVPQTTPSQESEQPKVRLDPRLLARFTNLRGTI